MSGHSSSMGHQLRYYLSLNDLLALEENLLALEPTALLHEKSVGPEPRVLKSSNLIEDGNRWHHFYLVRQSDIAGVSTIHVPSQNNWHIDELRSPVIEFNHCVHENNILRPGRLYYISDYYDKSGRLVRKAPDFRRWAKKVLSEAQNTLSYDRPLKAHLGREAASMRENGLLLATF